MVAGVAKYLNGVTAFRGRVVVVTSPSGIAGCENVKAPFPAAGPSPERTSQAESKPSKRAFWYHSNPQGGLLPPDSTGASHAFGRLRHAEQTWVGQFQKHAPRLKLLVLNISTMSDGRADTLAREGGAPGEACAHWCYPGLPHTWAEAMLRLLEQSVFGGTDGLY